MISIYKITSKEETLHVGQTRDFPARKVSHNRSKRLAAYPGWQMILVDLAQDREEAVRLEQHYIDTLKPKFNKKRAVRVSAKRDVFPNACRNLPGQLSGDRTIVNRTIVRNIEQQHHSKGIPRPPLRSPEYDWSVWDTTTNLLLPRSK